MDKKKMTISPPKLAPLSRKNFINEPEKEIKNERTPWIGLNPEIIKTVNIRFALPEKVQAEYIVKNSLEYNSLHDFCKKAIMEKIEQELHGLEN